METCAFSLRATVALFHQVTAWRRSAGAAAFGSMWSRCLQLIVTYFAPRMHWFTLFEDYYSINDWEGGGDEGGQSEIKRFPWKKTFFLCPFMYYFRYTNHRFSCENWLICKKKKASSLFHMQFFFWCNYIEASNLKLDEICSSYLWLYLMFRNLKLGPGSLSSY